MDRNHQKIMTDLKRIIDSQDFKSKEDLENFLNQMTGKEIPSFPMEALSFEEQAQDLVFEAYDLPIKKAKINIQKALEIDSNCIEAYEYLSSTESDPKKAIKHLEKAVETGKNIFGGKYLKKNKGHFWGLVETRTFMRCMQSYSTCLYVNGKIEEGVAILEEMIELNPNDNQGVRDMLFLYLLELGDLKKFQKYKKMYKDDFGAFNSFNLALYLFLSEGDSEKANKQLKVAMTENVHVVKKIISKIEIKNFPEYYSHGDKNEADYYVLYAKKVWIQTEGAIDWLRKNVLKQTM